MLWGTALDRVQVLTEEPGALSLDSSSSVSSHLMSFRFSRPLSLPFRVPLPTFLLLLSLFVSERLPIESPFWNKSHAREFLPHGGLSQGVVFVKMVQTKLRN